MSINQFIYKNALVIVTIGVDMNKKELLGLRLREIRKKNKISQEKLAELIEVDPTTISNIENGKNYPSLNNLENLLNVLNCTFVDIFDFEHKNSTANLIERINEILKENPEKIEEFYKILTAITK